MSSTFGPSSPYFNAHAWRFLCALNKLEADGNWISPANPMILLRDVCSFAKISEADAWEIVQYFCDEGVLVFSRLGSSSDVLVRLTGKKTKLENKEGEAG